MLAVVGLILIVGLFNWKLVLVVLVVNINENKMLLRNNDLVSIDYLWNTHEIIVFLKNSW